MSFANPALLAAIAILPLGLLLTYLARGRRRRYALRFPATSTVAAVIERAPIWRRVIPPALLMLSATALAMALAKPETTVSVPVEEASVVLVSDASGSMAATDVEPSRLDAARDAALTFLKRVPEELRVGLVGFSSAPHTVLRPALDRDALEVTLGGLAAGGGTATGDALDAALGTIGPITADGKHPPAAIVLLSDGKVTEGRDPIEVARQAGRLDIPVYTVALGTPDGVVPGGPGGYIPVPPDPETLQEMARVSKGQAFTAEDADELEGVYEQLGRQVGTRPEQKELTSGFAGAGLLLLLAAVGSSAWWRGRV